MAAPTTAPYIEQQTDKVPLKMVGGNHFGRYSKISVEQTFNLIVSDDFLVPYGGYKNILEQSPTSVGRGLYSSNRGNFMLMVLGNAVYRVGPTLSVEGGAPVGFLSTGLGDVFMAENNNYQINITDGVHVYCYTYQASVGFPVGFVSLPIGGTDPDLGVPVGLTNPGYISFQNGNFLVADNSSNVWYLSKPNNGLVFPFDEQHVGLLQTKPDYVQAAVPMPGGGNNMILFGTNVAELWQYTASSLFQYQRQSTFNADFGCINPATIAFLDTFVVWIAVNEQSGPVLMVYSGGSKPQSISTDGIDFKLGNLQYPEDCTGFIYKQDGHTLYQFTFYNDNLSYAYDFESKLFFTVTDENLNYHIARDVVFFNNQYYFVSINGGNLYQFGSQYTTANYGSDNDYEIPRIRICPPLRLPDSRYYIANNVVFTIEQGQQNTITNHYSPTGNTSNAIATESMVPIATEAGVIIGTEGTQTFASVPFYTSSTNTVYLSISRDGGENFSSAWAKNMNPTGMRKSRFIWQQLGIVNDCTFQFKFVGFNRFVVGDGIAEIYQ